MVKSPKNKSECLGSGHVWKKSVRSKSGKVLRKAHCSRPKSTGKKSAGKKSKGMKSATRMSATRKSASRSRSRSKSGSKSRSKTRKSPTKKGKRVANKWIKALKVYAKKRGEYVVPKKGTAAYREVMKIMKSM